MRIGAGQYLSSFLSATQALVHRRQANNRTPVPCYNDFLPTFRRLDQFREAVPGFENANFHDSHPSQNSG